MNSLFKISHNIQHSSFLSSKLWGGQFDCQWQSQTQCWCLIDTRVHVGPASSRVVTVSADEEFYSGVTSVFMLHDN